MEIPDINFSTSHHLITKPKIKILLVDDREDNLFSIQTVLEKDEYYFSKANSGKQALKILLKEYDFTLILMDVEMPDINGLETASLIYEREKLKHIPIIFITANNYSEEYVYKGYSSGAVDYIYKPINPQLLRAKVSVFVELYKKNHLLIAQEQRLQEINSELEQRVFERTQEIIRKNKELEFTNKELTKVNNDLDNFIYTASHDLKAPVSNIEGLLNALKTTLDDATLKNEETNFILDMMEKSIHQFKSTILDLAEISKIQKDLEHDISLVNIKEVIDEVTLSINDMIRESKANIIIDVAQCNEVRFSKKNLKSIIINLLTNALKYKDAERLPEVVLQTQENNEYILLTVKDNGIGINLNDSNKIFKMFKRLHNHVEGSGIGLYIVKRILDNSGNKIEVESEVGVGSVFKIYFYKTNPLV